MTRDAIMAELLEIEGMLEDDRLNDEIHPDRTTKGYAGIRIGLRAAEGEGEMTDEDESTDPGIIAAVFATRSRHDGGISVPHEIGQTASPIVFQSHPVRC